MLEKNRPCVNQEQSCDTEESSSVREITVGENIDMCLKELQYRIAELVQLKQETPSHVLKMRLGFMRRLTNL